MDERFDVVIKGDKTIGYMLDRTANPSVKKGKVSPTLNATALAAANAPYTAADAGPPYPLLFNNWVDGAGQVNVDVTQDFSAYRSSRNIDPSYPSQFSLGPGTVSVSYPTIGNQVVMADDLWLSFNPDGAGGQIRRLIRGSDPPATEQAVWASTAPNQAVTALETDGELIYAALHNLGSSNGSIVSGTAAGSDTSVKWASYSATANILDLCYCNGLVYAVRKNYTTGEVTAGYINGSGTFVQITGDADVWPGVESKGLVRLNNNVYWLVTGQNRAFVYMVQHSTTDTFQLAAELPRSFTATSLFSSEGNIYIGGYTDTGELFSSATGSTRIQGSIYVLANGTDLSHLFSIDNGVQQDCSVLALSAFNRFVYALTSDGIYRYDMANGSYHHYCDAPVSTSVVTQPSMTWSDKFYHAVWSKPPGSYDWTRFDLGNVDAHETFTGPVIRARGQGVEGDTTHPVDASGLGWAGMMGLQVLPNKCTGWYMDDPMIGSGSTILFRVGGLWGKAGQVGICDSKVSGLIRMHGNSNGYHFYLGSWDQTTATYTWETKWEWLSTFSPNFWCSMWATLDTVNGLQLYYNYQVVASLAYESLRPADGTIPWLRPQSVHFACGAPSYPTPVLTSKPTINFLTVDYSTSGAVPESDGGTVTTVYSPENIAIDSGKVYSPMPGASLLISDPKLQAPSGYITTSVSALQAGTKSKFFNSVEVARTPLLDGQSVAIAVYVDGMPVPPVYDTGPSDSTKTSVKVGVSGGSIFSTVTLYDIDEEREPGFRIKPTSITTFFNILPQGTTYTFVFDCTGKTFTLDGKPYTDFVDTKDAIANLFSIGNTIVDIESNYGNCKVYVEDLEENGEVVDPTKGGREKGRVQVTMQEVV